MLRITVVLIFLLSLASCTNANETTLVNDIDSKWDKKKIQSFDFNINDFQNQKNLIFIIRNNNDYPYSNIRVIASIEHNKIVISKDTLNYVLAKPNGEWLGTGFGETKEA